VEGQRLVRRGAGGFAAICSAFAIVMALVAPAFAESQAAAQQASGTAGTSGTVTSPQPRSNADNNGLGANQTGPYDSTRNGAPSLNGNGNGQATGRPCAGCVGKADNKNPPGQFPNGGDPNAGYECDRNHGIGRTNPAHTSCVTAPRGPGGSGSTAPNGTVSGSRVSRGTVPGGTTPGSTTPGGTVPGGTVPGGTVPGGTVPGGPQVLGTVVTSALTVASAPAPVVAQPSLAG
jgi:hypothetical protein